MNIQNVILVFSRRVNILFFFYYLKAKFGKKMAESGVLALALPPNKIHLSGPLEMNPPDLECKNITIFRCLFFEKLDLIA